MPQQGANKWIITITVILASVIELIDTSIVNVALPQMMGNLGATLDQIAWVVTGYVVANVIVIPMTGWFAANFGRRNYFIGSIVLFTVASFFCGHATSLWELVHLPLHPGSRRRRHALDLAGDPGRDLPARGARARQRPLRPRRGRRPDRRPDPRRLDHRQLLLALDLLRQPADRHRRGR